MEKSGGSLLPEGIEPTELDPQVRRLLELAATAGHPRIWESTLAEARELPGGVAALTGSGPEMRSERTLSVGSSPVPVRVYSPAAAPGDAVVVYFHGGGWTVGSIDDYDALARRLAAASGCEVVSVDYRLAPEHPYPAALEDACAAFDWAAALAAGRPMVLVGDSAGGNLAAVLARRVAEAARADVDLRLQVLIYPVTDCDFTRPSYGEHGNSGYPLGAQEMEWFWDQYVPDVTRRSEPDAAPIRGELAGLPPALVLVAGHDPLHDEGVAYAKVLDAAGVDVRLSAYPGAIHGFFHLAGYLDSGDRAVAEVAAAIRDAGRKYKHDNGGATE